MLNIPAEIENEIRRRVVRDLQPGILTVYIKTGLAVLSGGTVSLFLCAQFGYGMTGFAEQINHSVHGFAGSIGCALVCGALFALLPIAVLRAICSPIQFRVLSRQGWHAGVVWLAVFGGVLTHLGNFGRELMLYGMWLCSAYLVFWMLGRLLDVLGSRVLMTSEASWG